MQNKAIFYFHFDIFSWWKQSSRR